MLAVPYSSIRDQIKVGDVIGCQGHGYISRVIRYIKGGEWDLSHVATIFRDVSSEGFRVEVLEAIGDRRGMQRNFLSRIYEAAHGTLFWIPMNCSEEQKKKIVELGVKVLEKKVKYDFRTTWLAAIMPIFVDTEKFNCSEFAWYVLTRASRLLKRFDRKGREIAPAPGDLPTWAGVEPIKIIM